MKENIKIANLFEQAKSGDSTTSMYALSNLGYLIERHIKQKYNDEEYRDLFIGDKSLYNLEISDIDLENAIHFLFYYILNNEKEFITAIWCLGKCHDFDILNGMKKLLFLFKDNDDAFEQILFSLTSLYDWRIIFDDIFKITDEIFRDYNLPKSKIKMTEIELMINPDSSDISTQE